MCGPGSRFLKWNGGETPCSKRSWDCTMIKTHRLITGVEVERQTESVVPKTLENVGE